MGDRRQVGLIFTVNAIVFFPRGCKILAKRYLHELILPLFWYNNITENVDHKSLPNAFLCCKAESAIPL